MYKINIVCVGKIKETFFRQGVEEYLKRLSRFAKCEVKEIAESRTLDEEGENIIKQCKGYIIALCVEGKKTSSEGLAKIVKSLVDAGKEITFVIGSSHGLCQKVKNYANERLSFSDMTFPHQLMRVILCEQIYRSFMIISGSEYHK